MKHFVELVDDALDNYTHGDGDEVYMTLLLGVRRCAPAYTSIARQTSLKRKTAGLLCALLLHRSLAVWPSSLPPEADGFIRRLFADACAQLCVSAPRFSQDAPEGGAASVQASELGRAHQGKVQHPQAAFLALSASQVARFPVIRHLQRSPRLARWTTCAWGDRSGV